MTRTKTRALANWPNNAVSVLDFGAVSLEEDPTADSTNAFKEAFKTHKEVHIPRGTYRLTDTITLYHPFNVKGDGMENTLLIWSGIGEGGLSTAKDGISVECRDPYTHASGFISDMTLAVSGNGGRAFGTEKAQTKDDDSVSVVQRYAPRYIVERLQIRGNTVRTGNLYQDGWRVGVDIGCSREPVIRDCYFMGQFMEGLTSNSDDDEICQTRAIEIGGSIANEYPAYATVNSAVTSALVDHCFVYYYGTGLWLGHRLSQGVARACHLNTCWNGVFCPDSIGGRYTYTEFLVHDMQIQAQRFGVKGNSGWLTYNNIRSSRSGGADTALFPWYGFHFDGAGQVVLTNSRAYLNVDETSQIKENYGVYFANADYLKATNNSILGNQKLLDIGFYLHQGNRVQILNNSITNADVGYGLAENSIVVADKTLITNVNDEISYLANMTVGKRRSQFGNIDIGSYAIGTAVNPTSAVVTLIDSKYKRIDDTVEFEFTAYVAPSVTNQYVTFEFYLPDFSLGNFGETTQLSGSAIGQGTDGMKTAQLSAVLSSKRGLFSTYADSTSQITFTASGKFTVL